MKKKESISQLGYVLLGLIAMKPSNGYELRKIFESTPMGRYSSSPGAIYPALKKLQVAGAVATRQTTGKTARSVQHLTVTRAGKEALHAWLRILPSKDDIGRDFDNVLLRFSYLGLLQDEKFSLQFLEAMETAITQNQDSVQQFVSTMPAEMPLHGKLPLQYGLDVMRTQLQWVQHAKQDLRDKDNDA